MNGKLTFRHPVSTFGHIHEKALHVQLKKMGEILSLLRKARQEEFAHVAAEINIRPDVLQKNRKWRT